MQLISEAGVTGLVIIVTFVAALGLRVTGRASSSTPGVLALLATGLIGQGLGQRAVAAAVRSLEGVTKEDLAVVVAQGSAEASANLLLAGACALVLLAVGAAKSLNKDA